VDAVAKEDDSSRENNDRTLAESPIDKLKRGIADLRETLLSKESGPISRELGKVLEMLIIPGADQEIRLDALLALLSKPDGSLQEFGKAAGMPIDPNADPESLEVVLESCRLLLSLSLDDDIVGVVDRPSPEHTNHALTSAETHDQLLLHFASFNGGAVDEIRAKPDWERLLGESLGRGRLPV